MDLITRSRRVTHGYRLGETAQAHEDLAHFIDALALALGRPPLAQRGAAIMATLEQVLDAQLRVDTLCIADLLEYRLAPLLEGA